MEEKPLYSEVVRVTDRYLGPTADRFIQRQIRNHLHIEPADLSQADLPRLIGWVKVTLAMITDDDKLINDYLEELERLADRR